MKIIFLLFLSATSIVTIFAATTKNSKVVSKWRTLDGTPTILMGHRGEKVFMPEHTVASYELASAEGAEFVEPDLTLTADGELVCFHDLILKSGTDVEEKPEFVHLKRNFSGELEGNLVNYTNEWFIQNFTLVELQTLRVKQKMVGIRLQYFNDLFHIPTFEEYLDVVHKMSYKMNKPIGVIPELKHPAFNNLPWDTMGGTHYIETKLVNTLRKFGYPVQEKDQPACTFQNQNITCGEVIIQSFSQSSLEHLKTKTNRDLMMLVDDNVKLLTYEGLNEVSKFAAYYGIWKEHLYTGAESVLAANGKTYDPILVDRWGGFVPADKFVNEGHNLGMKMGIYTIYDSREPSRRGCAKKCDPENKTKELYFYFNMGIDGMFVENIMEARELRLQFENLQSRGVSARFRNGNQYVVLIIGIIVNLYFANNKYCL